MDALKLYNYHSIPEQVKKFNLPAQKKRKVIKEVILTQVKYICYSCSKEVELKLSDEIKCSHCDNRILKKTKHETPQTYDSI